MTPLRKRMIDDMVSAGLAPNTQAAYIRGVLGLAAHYHRSPDNLVEPEVRGYLLHLRDDRGVAQGTYRPYHAGIQFLYARTLDHDWALFSKKGQGTEAQTPARRSLRCRSSRRRRQGTAACCQDRLPADVCLRPAHQRSRHA